MRRGLPRRRTISARLGRYKGMHNLPPGDRYRLTDWLQEDCDLFAMDWATLAIIAFTAIFIAAVVLIAIRLRR